MTEPRTSLIVPLMKARVPAEVQLEFPLPAEEEPIRDPLAGDLYVTYALELTGEAAGGAGRPGGAGGPRYEHIARRHCAELGVAPEDLRRLAVVNLRNRRPDLALSWYPDVRAVTVSLGAVPGAGDAPSRFGGWRRACCWTTASWRSWRRTWRATWSSPRPRGTCSSHPAPVTPTGSTSCAGPSGRCGPRAAAATATRRGTSRPGRCCRAICWCGAAARGRSSPSDAAPPGCFMSRFGAAR
ncbi:hypothetical protein [Actinomadura keratinilytica]|uniref:hypothetical protein n=1 Tax=Actinomadura keratinilytica TaxID=547461 RepID=UPI0036191F18